MKGDQVPFPGKSSIKLNHKYLSIGKWTILVGMLYLAGRFVNPGEVMTGFKRVSLLTLFSFLVLILLSKFLYAIRWYLICKNGLGLPSISTFTLLRINLLAEFVSIAMPSSLGGEAARIFKLGRQTEKRGRSTTSVVTDRLVGIISMGLISLVLIPKLGISITWQLPVSATGLKITGVLVGSCFSLALFWLYHRRKSLPDPIQQIKFNLFLVTSLVLLSVSGHLIFASGYYLLFKEFQPIDLLTAIALLMTAQLARSIPVSILGIGLNEGSLVALGGLVGVKPEATLVIIIITTGGRYLFALIGFLLELSYDGRVFFNTIAKHSEPSLEITQ